MRVVGALLAAIIFMTILLLSFGNFQQELSKTNYNVTYDEDDFQLKNVTEKIENISESISKEVDELQLEQTGILDKASAFLGATMHTGRLVLAVPSVITATISEVSMKTPLPLSGTTIVFLITSILIIFIVFEIWAWRRAG